MKRHLRSLLARWHRALAPQPSSDDISRQSRIEALESQLLVSRLAEQQREDANMEQIAELLEARQMAGAGPWQVSGEVQSEARRIMAAAERAQRTGTYDLSLSESVRLRETNPIVNQGAYGDIELALSNVEWRREVNLSWLEFSRWGIQQIILICRLHFIKNPIIRRLINISAIYVFGRGVEVSSPDDDANQVLKEFFERNQSILGRNALVDLERRKWYDGNLFFAFFRDELSTGEITVRTIDATEIQDVVTDPDDADKPRYYKRIWTQKQFDLTTAGVRIDPKTAWYPALGYEPEERPEKIGNDPVMWDSPVYHRKCGTVAKWHFGCPEIYPAIDWAKAAKRFLEACMTVKVALSQIAMTLTTKGGQQAMAGGKQQLQTTVGPSSSLWDQNPPAVSGSIFASGPGTKLDVFPSKGGGGDPEEVRRYLLMCCMVAGVPETFLADVSTGNLATATTLDRPTELMYLDRQEAWIEDLTVIATEVLRTSARAPSGKLREALARRHADGEQIRIVEARSDGQPARRGEIEISVNFPAIREGDIPALVSATVAAMTLGNSDGAVVGIDEKQGVRHLADLLGLDNVDELTEAMYPDDEYDADRVAAAAEKAAIPSVPPTPQPEPAKAVEGALGRLLGALKLWESRPEVTNGNARR